MTFVSQFHLIRPEWLWLIMPVLLLLGLFYYYAKNKNQWQKVIDTHLLNYLLPHYQPQKQTKLFIVLLLIMLISIFALIGPSFWQKKSPIYALDTLQVILLDASDSTWTTDIKPTRFTRSILLIKQLLKQHQEGETMLIAFSGEPYVISPFTKDDKPILNLLKGLTPEVLPKPGYRLDLALAYTQDLLKDYQHKQIDILLLTDTHIVDSQSLALAQQLAANGHRLSVIGIASNKPVPIANKNGFIKDKLGQPVLVKINERLLTILTNKGNGLYQRLDNDVQNIERYLAFSKRKSLLAQTKKQQKSTVQWVDFGVYLSLLLVPLALLLFKRGFLMMLLVVIMFVEPQGVYANNLLDTMWQTNNEQAKKLYDRGEYEAAAKKFNNPSWEANALYKSQQYEQAAELFSKLNEHYNAGNTFIAPKYEDTKQQIKQYENSIKQYEKVKKLDKNYANAQHNLKVSKEILALLKEQKEKSSQKNQQSQDGDKNKEKQQNQDKDQQQSEQENKEQNQDKDQQQSEQENKEQNQDKDQQQSEQENKEQNQDKDQQQSEQENKEQNQDKDQQQSEQSSEQKDKKEQQKKQSQSEKKAEEDEENKKQQAIQKAQQRQDQINKQKLAQYFKKIQTQPVDLLKQKFLIERRLRGQKKSKFINQDNTQSW